ncbi:Homeobox protein Hox-A11a [Wickerhamomyces ciferrii]|uniref:Homeobox protein Hox-A11a n=1 Tax=Wickerhamomyces ciferrii (strain ATCC 14091 / BCRC 22168 / CBS 111 / JCM 3599 / NBRC 0793 / NRRL Y-1031 F-60-10) TaxID=1206466 RepID=K0KK41_WICCF|nr:Homeobox protein Hox-A11a [Wickerhamomyces ciferrii]CCH41503.1 Homeobox protein Hox-A11a [Wickerhamomyces ciferrii]
MSTTPSIMLPVPAARFQSEQQQNNLPQVPQFSLPPIRELLKSTSPQQAPSRPATTTFQQPQQIHVQHPQPLYQPQPNTYQSPPFSNPISPISNTPEQQLRQQTPPNLPHYNHLPTHPQQAYSYQPQFQHLPSPHYSQQPSQAHSQQQSPSQLPSLPQFHNHFIESRSDTTSPILSNDYASSSQKDRLSIRKKRQNLPRQTTLILLNWLSDHLDRPYPNSREKYELLMKTRLTIQQLDNWFINARRRKINILKKLKENDQNIAMTF